MYHSSQSQSALLGCRRHSASPSYTWYRIASKRWFGSWRVRRNWQCRVERHRRPVRAADSGRLDQCRLFPEDLEYTSRSFVSLKRLGTLRHDRVADRKGLGFSCLLPRLLRHRPLLDASQRFAVGAVENVNPAGAAGFGDSLAGLPIDYRVEKDDRAGRVVIPDVVMHLLEVPGIFSGLGLQRDDRSAEQIVSFAHRPVIIRPAIADRKVDEPELRIERRSIPDRCAAAAVMVGAGRPGVSANLPRPGQGIPPPQDLAGLCVERSQPPAHTVFTTGNAAIDDAVIVERGAGDPVAVLPYLDRGPPHLLAGLAAEPGAFESGHPGAFELLDVARVNLFQCGVALIGQVAAVCDPVFADRALKQPIDLGIGGVHRSRSEQRQAER